MKKLLITICAIITLLLIFVFTAPYLFKDKIIELIKKTANDNVNAKIEFDNQIELSLIKNFPDFTLGMNNISVIGIDSFSNDTLLHLKQFQATLDVMSVIKGEKIKIEKVILNAPSIHAIILKSGLTNWDIAKASTDTVGNQDTTKSAFNISLKKFQIISANIKYDDRQSNLYAEIKDFSHTLIGDFSQDLFNMNMTNQISELTVSAQNIKYLNKVKLTFDADVEANMSEQKYSIKENNISLNALEFMLEGFVQMKGDNISMDLKYLTKSSEFKNFISLIPAIYANEFDDLQSSGKLGFEGFVKGIYSENIYPAFGLKLKVEDGMFKYPQLPLPVNDVQVNLEIDNSGGDLNNTIVNLSKFHFNLDKESFDAKFIAKNLINDPFIDASISGTLNLGNVSKIIPLEKGTKIEGLLKTNIQAKGSMSEIENKKYESFNASGNLEIQNFTYETPDQKSNSYLNLLSLSISPKIIKLNNLIAKMGKSDVSANGELTNFFPYLFNNGILSGLLNLSSENINANEFLSSDESTEENSAVADSSSITAPAIPSNINFTINARIAKMQYTNLDISNLVGQIRIANEKLEFNNIGLNTLGATMGLNGYYETGKSDKPVIDIDFSIKNLEFKKAFAAFNTVKKLAPIAENMEGTFSSSFKMHTPMDNKLNPIFAELFADGILDIPNAELKDVKLFKLAANILKNDNFKNPSIKNVKIKFEVKEGRIFTKPFDLTLAGQKLTMSGSSGLDQSLDYIGNTKFPRNAMGAANSALNSLLKQANNKAGTDVKMSESVNIQLLITGTFNDPKISTNLANTVKDETDNMKKQLAEEASRKIKELESKAKQEAARIKAEAELKAKAEADKLKAEYEKQKKAAEEKANAEKERLKKQAEEEAKKKLKSLLK